MDQDAQDLWGKQQLVAELSPEAVQLQQIAWGCQPVAIPEVALGFLKVVQGLPKVAKGLPKMAQGNQTWVMAKVVLCLKALLQGLAARLPATGLQTLRLLLPAPVQSHQKLD